MQVERKSVGNNDKREIDILGYLGVILVDNTCVKCYFSKPERPSQCGLAKVTEQTKDSIKVSWNMNEDELCWKITGYKIEVANTSGQWR